MPSLRCLSAGKRDALALRGRQPNHVHARAGSAAQSFPGSPNFACHPAGDNAVSHAEIGDEAQEGVAEGSGLVVFHEEVADPGEGVARRNAAKQEPKISRGDD